MPDQSTGRPSATRSDTHQQGADEQDVGAAQGSVWVVLFACSWSGWLLHGGLVASEERNQAAVTPGVPHPPCAQPAAAASAPSALACVRQSVWLGLVPAQRSPSALRLDRSCAHRVSACFWM